jgi:hypothetical protein
LDQALSHLGAIDNMLIFDTINNNKWSDLIAILNRFLGVKNEEVIISHYSFFYHRCDGHGFQEQETLIG